MHANLSTWKLAPHVRDEEPYAEFIARLLQQTLPMARVLGLLDSMIVRVGDDTIVAINVYEDEASAADAWTRARTLITRHYGNELEFVSITTGRADDMPQLTRAE
jgi:hypothetical protein